MVFFWRMHSCNDRIHMGFLKNESNFKKHDVTFENAKELFDDNFHIILIRFCKFY